MTFRLWIKALLDLSDLDGVMQQELYASVSTPRPPGGQVRNVKSKSQEEDTARPTAIAEITPIHILKVKELSK